VGNATLARRQGIPTPARGNEKIFRISEFSELKLFVSSLNSVEKTCQVCCTLTYIF
jgi:hypothetical protein